jgi:hypothetical protein
MAIKYRIQVSGGKHTVLTVDDADLNTVLGVRSFVTRGARAVEVGGGVDIEDQATTQKIFIGLPYDDILKFDNTAWAGTIGDTVIALNAFFITTPHELEDLDDVPAPTGTDTVLTYDGAGNYTWEEGGGELLLNNLPWDLGDLSFGRLTGSGTFTPPPAGISVTDFIANVLITQSLELTAVPSTFAYSQTSLSITVTPTFAAGWTTASVTRVLNGVETVIEASPSTTVAIVDSVPGLVANTVYTLVYKLNVSDAYGTSDVVTATVTQTPYAAPTVTNFIPARAAGSGLGDNETNYFREIGNFQSNVTFTTNRNTPLVDLTTVDLIRDAAVIDTEIPSNPTHAFSHADTTAPTTGASYTYSVRMQDPTSYSPTTYTASAITFGKPVLFTTDTGNYTSSSTNADLQNVIDNYVTAAGYYRIRSNEAGYTFSCKAAMNDNTKYTYIMYDSSLGALTNLKQGGSTGTDIVFNDLGTFTVTNQFSESLSMRVYRSPFTQAFAENVDVYIEF